MTFNWQVQTYDFDLSTSTIFYLRIAPTGYSTGPTATCHYFNITYQIGNNPSITSTTSTITSTTTSPPDTSSSSNTHNDALSTAAPPSPTNSSSISSPQTQSSNPDNLSNAATIGSIIGSIAGVVTIVTGAIKFHSRIKRFFGW
jgi:hypothetical protein